MVELRSGDEHASPDSVSGTGSARLRQVAQRAWRPERRHPLMRRGAITVAAGLTMLLVLGFGVYFKLSGNITTLDVSGLLGERPVNSAVADRTTNLRPLNILVMGLDTRNLGTTRFGTIPGERPDTNLLVHLSADRKSAVVVSIPRDSMTRAPRNCKDPSSKVADGPIRQWNANFGLGGPACVIRTLEGNTGIPIDHFMVVNFLGFQSMVDALGSVEVCLPEAVNDTYTHLKLPAGRSTLTGDQALSFVRVRYIGDGTDISRISRQQGFLSSMIQKATSSQLLLRPDKLLRFLDAATKSVATDPGLGNLNAMRELAQSVVGMKTSQIRFVTVPVEEYPSDHMRRQWTSDADALWKSIHDDAPLPGNQPPGPTAGSTRAPTSVPPLGTTPLPNRRTTAGPTPTVDMTIKARTADTNICAP